jgi:hypothetical protein
LIDWCGDGGVPDLDRLLTFVVEYSTQSDEYSSNSFINKKDGTG